MTVFKYGFGGRSSVIKENVGDHAFSDDTKNAADSLIVDSGHYLHAAGLDANGAFLANTKAWTVSINGSVISEQAEGILLEAGNPPPRSRSAKTAP